METQKYNALISTQNHFMKSQAENQAAKVITSDPNDSSHVKQIIALEKQQSNLYQGETQEIERDYAQKRAILDKLKQIEKEKTEQNENASVNSFAYQNPEYNNIYMNLEKCSIEELQNFVEAYKEWNPNSNNNDNYIGDGWDKNIVEEEEEN